MIGDDIYKIKGIELEKVKQNSPLDQWFYGMIQKKESELTLLDLSRLLRQEIYLDIAIPLAWKKILENPFCGEMYEGQLVELLIRTLENNSEKKENSFYRFFVQDIAQKIETHEWGNDEEKNEYKRLTEELERLFE